MSNYGVVLFYTSSSAMQAEAVLLRAKLSAKLIPTPRELSSDCGVALRFDWSQSELVQSMLNKSRVEIAGIHPKPGK
jgi:Protein of unknown function (DUF3343)